MARQTRRVLFGLTVLWLGAGLAQVANLGGTWVLNVAKSQWGKARRPVGVVLEIQHSEPVLKYHGTVTYATDDTRDFGFDGAIDGKEYALARSYGVGKVKVERVNASTLTSTFRSDDGLYVETTRNSVSRDGKVMTRRIQLKGPAETVSWTEVYEKR